MYLVSLVCLVLVILGIMLVINGWLYKINVWTNCIVDDAFIGFSTIIILIELVVLDWISGFNLSTIMVILVFMHQL